MLRLDCSALTGAVRRARLATVTGAFEEGMLLRERRRLVAAVGAFERAVVDDPDDARAWFWLAATRDNRALEADAIPAYEQALRLGLEGDDEARAWTWLASSYSKVGCHGDALSAVERAEAIGGYEPRHEFERVVRSVRRRSTPKS
jgi:tetratricopeptide (TPR) repeat protein